MLQDHPRVGGEKAIRPPALSCGWGSPPRVRGKERFLREIGVDIGITPACAGKSRIELRVLPLREDHPRVCGEKMASRTISLLVKGSPPRVRGKVGRRISARRSPRITPACAGKSRGEPVELILREDHPRVCGEKRKSKRRASGSPGSPPRVRGKAIWRQMSSKALRITPACAGKRKAPSLWGR